MSIYTELLSKHQGLLTEQEAQRVQQKIDIKQQTVEFTKNTPNLSRCLIKIEPVTVEQPIHLFGQAPRTNAFNKLTIHTAKYNTEKECFEPDQEIISAMLSEQQLARIMIETNSCTTMPMTALSALGEKMPAYQFTADNSYERAVEQLADKNEKAKALLLKLKAEYDAAAQKTSLSKKSAEEMQSLLGQIANCFANRFYLKNLFKALSKDKSAAQAELANMINRSFSPQVNQLLLEDRAMPLSPDTNFLFNAMSGYENDEDRAAQNKLLVAEIHAMAARHGIETEGLEVEQIFKDMEYKLPHKGDDTDLFGTLKSLYNHTHNENVIRNAVEQNPHELSISMHKVTGHPYTFFSEYAANCSQYFELRVHSAQVKNFYGDADVRANDTLLEVALLPEDLMNVFRGYVNGGYVQCTMTMLCMHRVPHTPYYNTEEQDIVDSAKDKSVMHDTQFGQTLNALRTRLQDKVSKKADKQAVSEMIETLIESLSEANQYNADHFDELAQKAIDMVQKDLMKHIEREGNTLKLDQNKVKALIQMV